MLNYSSTFTRKLISSGTFYSALCKKAPLKLRNCMKSFCTSFKRYLTAFNSLISSLLAICYSIGGRILSKRETIWLDSDRHFINTGSILVEVLRIWLEVWSTMRFSTIRVAMGSTQSKKAGPRESAIDLMIYTAEVLFWRTFVLMVISLTVSWPLIENCILACLSSSASFDASSASCILRSTSFLQSAIKHSIIGPKYCLKSCFKHRASYENVFYITNTYGSASSNFLETNSSTK